MDNNFIFGYGSLINAESRAITGVSGEVIPLKVTGVRREWGHIISVAKITGLNLVENPDSWCNGGLASIDETELLNFDQREDDGGYRRILLEENKITGLPKEFSGEKIWVYVGKNSKPMAEDAPIIQSYIDIAMSGCLSFGENFAREFVISTYRWNTPWVNDRLNPIYPRAMKEVPLAGTIDRILKEEIPTQFFSRINP